jgi:hypothetical protein
MEERGLQLQDKCMSLQDLGSAVRGRGVAALPNEPFRGLLKGTPVDDQQMFNFLDAPGLLQPSPGDLSGTGRAPRRGLGRQGVASHSGVDLSSLRCVIPDLPQVVSLVFGTVDSTGGILFGLLQPLYQIMYRHEKKERKIGCSLIPQADGFYLHVCMLAIPDKLMEF